MNVFFAGLGAETNSFSAIPTAEAAFARGQRRGEAVFGSRGMYGEMARALRDLVSADGGVVAPGLFAWAQPAGPTVQSVYERLRDALLDDLRTAMPVDMVLLFLHGAMIAQDCWDCEGEILARVRDIVGPRTPVGVVLDPHAHLTQTMIDQATLRSVVVKSSYHYRAGFGPLAADMITVDAPGPVRVDYAAIPYRRFTAPYWPKVENP